MLLRQNRQDKREDTRLPLSLLHPGPGVSLSRTMTQAQAEDQSRRFSRTTTRATRTRRRTAKRIRICSSPLLPVSLSLCYPRPALLFHQPTVADRCSHTGRRLSFRPIFSGTKSKNQRQGIGHRFLFFCFGVFILLASKPKPPETPFCDRCHGLCD